MDHYSTPCFTVAESGKTKTYVKHFQTSCSLVILFNHAVPPTTANCTFMQINVRLGFSSMLKVRWRIVSTLMMQPGTLTSPRMTAGANPPPRRRT